MFEYHIRYLANGSKHKYRSSSSHQALFIIAFTIAFIIASTGSTLSEPTPAILPWPNIPIQGDVQHLTVYDKDGSIFLAINSDIYKYSSELKLLTSTLTSTSTSNETKPIDLKNKFLLLMKWNNLDVLLSCWQTMEKSLDCWLNKIDEIRHGLHLLLSNETKGYQIDSSVRMMALYNQDDLNDLVFVAGRTAEDQKSPNISHLPAISRFKISKYPKNLLLEQKAVLTYKTVMPDNYPSFEYIYLFKYNHHTHFILNNNYKQNLPSPSNQEAQHHVRLAKICNNDTDLTSYTEISLTCNNQKNIYTKHAYFDSTVNDPVLYIVFESLDHATSLPHKSNGKSYLCSYSIKLIEDNFNNAISNCNKGEPDSRLLSKFHPYSGQPPFCQKNPSTDWCSSKLNPYIDGSSYRYVVNEDRYMVLDDLLSVNFFYSTKQGPDSKDVVFLGTESGFLTKMSFVSEDLYYTINLSNNQIKNYQPNEKFQIINQLNETHPNRMTKYAFNYNHITAISNNMMSQLDINECYYYTTCRACLSTTDPLMCEWCGNSCTRRKDCQLDRATDLSCPPKITDFSPKFGPITGDTILKIEGDNLGSARGTRTVKLDEHECLINSQTSSENLIECRTKPVALSTNTTLTINVLDESGPISSKGMAIAGDSFSYVRSLVYGINPTSGFYSTENLVNVYGEYLNVGSSRRVALGNQTCKITEMTSNKISCLLTSIKDFKVNSTNSPTIHLLIDNHEQTVSARPIFKGLNLSTTYLLSVSTPLPQQEEVTSMIPVNESKEFETSSYSLFIILTGFSLVIILILLFVFKEKLPHIKIKLPQAFELNDDKYSDNKVSFRNPQSMRFGSSNLNPDATISSGLVKLNGSVISSDYFGKQEQLEQDQPLMNNFLDNELLTLLVQEKILIDRSRLTLGHVLGSGQFGRVYKGFLKDPSTGEHVAVAVKTLHNRSSWDDALDNRAFVEEGLMMRDFEHNNVLALIGVTFDSNGLPMVVTPFMLYGDLRSYISDEASSPTVKELIDFGTQVARGMAYLSSLKFVHRDLAARNCMLDDNLVVKVADFGLSRDIYERDYYSSDNKKAKLPVKWMAIESLEKCIYNTKTDVWSYGVLLWELMTRGVVPYPDVDNFDLFSYLKEGRRMLRPRYCPLILYKIMVSCWHEDPSQRPTFDELVKKVSDVINQLKIAKDGQQKVSRDETYCDVLK